LSDRGLLDYIRIIRAPLDAIVNVDAFHRLDGYLNDRMKRQGFETPPVQVSATVIKDDRQYTFNETAKKRSATRKPTPRQ
jgi:hypothetical protein